MKVISMKQAALAALVASGIALTPAAADARRHDPGHGKCLRFNKTTGTVAGAVGGGVLGNVLLGGTGGTLVGAAAGGLAGHELSHNRRKRCR